jgi:holo-[acyl-carrier protein] synthase
MIVGIGVDSVEISRFDSWANMNPAQLKKVFSQEEIAYCLKSSIFSAQRFAVRFAAREAFFKALCAMQRHKAAPFLRVCKSVAVLKDDDQIPFLYVNWKNLLCNLHDESPIIAHISLTHTSNLAIAYIILEK